MCCAASLEVAADEVRSRNVQGSMAERMVSVFQGQTLVQIPCQSCVGDDGRMDAVGEVSLTSFEELRLELMWARNNKHKS